MKCECTPGGVGGLLGAGADALGKDGNGSPFGNSVPNSLSGPMSPFSIGLGGLLIQSAKKFKL